MPSFSDETKTFGPEALVVIVDDLLTLRKAIKRTCRDLGAVNFVEAFDGKDALFKIRQAEVSITLIISDWEMPEMSGMELLKNLKSDLNTRSTPFLLLPDESHLFESRQALQAGADDILIKPFTSNGLKNRILEIMAKQNQLPDAG